MSIRLLMLLLRVTQVLVGVAVGFVLLGFAIHIAHGGPFTANWPVVTTDALVHPLRAGAGTIRIDRGALALASPDWRPELAQLLFVLAFAGGAIFALIQLKHVVRSIASGEPFAPETARRLRIIGWLVIGWALFDVANALVVEPLLLAAATPVEFWGEACFKPCQGRELPARFPVRLCKDWSRPIRVGAGPGVCDRPSARRR